jgi:hypothetical protein
MHLGTDTFDYREKKKTNQTFRKQQNQSPDLGLGRGGIAERGAALGVMIR